MNRDLNIKLILRILGGLLLVEGVFLFFPVFVALLYREHDIRYYLYTIFIAVGMGSIALLIGRKAENVFGKREGAVIVTVTWLMYTVIGTLPLWLSGNIPAFTDAFFESLSGFTTTGTSILNNIEALPYNMLLWRSLTHWIGGLGIVAMFLAIMPMLGGAGYELFSSESTTPIKEKILPKISQTAKILLLIYVVLTMLCAFSLKIAGMDWFDAINHALSTISTGGFSTKQLSIAYWNSPAIEYVLIFFMFFSGVNFIIFYYLYKFNWVKIRKNEELKYYIVILLASVLVIAYSQIDFSRTLTLSGIEKSLRGSLFIVTSCMTTTGLCTDDYTLWKSYTWIILLVLMVSGASTYSTSGGIKVARVVLLTKFCYFEFKKLIHPNAIIPVRFNGFLVRDDLMMRVLAFTVIYLLIIVAGSFVLSLTGLGFEEAISGMITCMSDVGLGLGKLGPSSSFAEIPVVSKWFLAFVMLVGRLEIYSVLLLFTPEFWKK